MTYDEECIWLQNSVGSAYKRLGYLHGLVSFRHNPNFLLVEITKEENPIYELGALDSTILFYCSFLYNDKEGGTKMFKEAITGVSHFNKLFKKMV